MSLQEPRLPQHRNRHMHKRCSSSRRRRRKRRRRERAKLPRPRSGLRRSLSRRRRQPTAVVVSVMLNRHGLTQQYRLGLPMVRLSPLLYRQGSSWYQSTMSLDLNLHIPHIKATLRRRHPNTTLSLDLSCAIRTATSTTPSLHVRQPRLDQLPRMGMLMRLSQSLHLLTTM